MITYFLTTFLCSLALADDPDTSENPSEETSEETEPSSTTDHSTEIDTETDTDSPIQESVTDPQSSDTEEKPETSLPEESTSTTVPKDNPNSEQNSDNNNDSTLTVDDEMTTEIEQMMSEIMEEMANSEENTLELGLEIEVDEEDDEFNYKGNIEYSYVLTMWDSPNRNIFHVAQFSGDPQYLFQQGEMWGYTVGARFLVTGSETLTQHYYNSLIGVTGGMQYGAFRINTAASWMWEQYFAQTETDKADGFITYQYNELAAMSGVLWENTLTYSPSDMDFGVQASVGFPFQVNGDREMGEVFKDAWQVSTRLNISLFQLGYTHIVYPGHSIQRVQIGSGILF